MLGAGERRLVLPDFLLIVLRETRTGSSDMCGYKVGGGSECTHGGKWGIHPNPSTSITSLHTGWRQLSETATFALQRPPARPEHRFRSHRCGFPAGTRSVPPFSLPPSSLSPSSCGWELAPGHPRRAPVPGPRGRRGACAGSAGLGPGQGHGQCRGGHAGTPRAHRHAPFASCPHSPRRKVPGPWCGMECPAHVRFGQGKAPTCAPH